MTRALRCALRTPTPWPGWNMPGNFCTLRPVGYARLSVVRLVGDGELSAVGSIWLALPEELRPRCKEAAITALRRLVGDETQSIKQKRAGEDLHQAAVSAFWSCENAKGEDIQDELALVSDAAEYRHFMSAARRLAGVRARQASHLLDGEDVHGANMELKTAVEERQRTLELLRATADRGKVRTGFQWRSRPTSAGRADGFRASDQPVRDDSARRTQHSCRPRTRRSCFV